MFNCVIRTLSAVRSSVGASFLNKKIADKKMSQHPVLEEEEELGNNSVINSSAAEEVNDSRRMPDLPEAATTNEADVEEEEPTASSSQFSYSSAEIEEDMETICLVTEALNRIKKPLEVNLSKKKSDKDDQFLFLQLNNLTGRLQKLKIRMKTRTEVVQALQQRVSALENTELEAKLQQMQNNTKNEGEVESLKGIKAAVEKLYFEEKRKNLELTREIEALKISSKSKGTEERSHQSLSSPVSESSSSLALVPVSSTLDLESEMDLDTASHISSNIPVDKEEKEDRTSDEAPSTSSKVKEDFVPAWKSEEEEEKKEDTRSFSVEDKVGDKTLEVEVSQMEDDEIVIMESDSEVEHELPSSSKPVRARNKSKLDGRNYAERSEESDTESILDITEYEVEKILKKRTVNGTVEYLVKWVGFELKDASWEPSKNLAKCSQSVRDFDFKMDMEEKEKAASRTTSKSRQKKRGRPGRSSGKIKDPSSTRSTTPAKRRGRSRKIKDTSINTEKPTASSDEKEIEKVVQVEQEEEKTEKEEEPAQKKSKVVHITVPVFKLEK